MILHNAPTRTVHCPRTLPAVLAVLLSFVSTFLNFFPLVISPNNAPLPAPPAPPPIAGGGGGAGGGAPPPIPSGIGGGGGGGPPGIGTIDGGIGGGPGGGALLLLNVDMGGATGVVGLIDGDFALSLSSAADKGRGGAIVPKRMEASCLALPPEGPFVSSSSEESSVESTTDHSSSSGRTREGREPVGVDERGG